MNDWTFSRPLPPGAFPDEDHLAGARPSAKKRDHKLVESAKQARHQPTG